jgi:phosphohistidine phosphatase
MVGRISDVSETKLLYVLRHAKSSWDDHDEADNERPLSDRGRRAVKRIAAYIAAHEIVPDLVLCSSARRTRETLDGLGLSGTVMVEHRLYGASCDDLVERLQLLPPEVGSVLLVGHNPALQMLVLRLAAAEQEGRAQGAEGLEEIKRKLPTGALVTLEINAAWPELKRGSAVLVDYIRPKALS